MRPCSQIFVYWNISSISTTFIFIFVQINYTAVNAFNLTVSFFQTEKFTILRHGLIMSFIFFYSHWFLFRCNKTLSKFVFTTSFIPRTNRYWVMWSKLPGRRNSMFNCGGTWPCNLGYRSKPANCLATPLCL